MKKICPFCKKEIRKTMDSFGKWVCWECGIKWNWEEGLEEAKVSGIRDFYGRLIIWVDIPKGYLVVK